MEEVFNWKSCFYLSCFEVEGREEGGLLLKPREATIRLTNACNAKCEMCEIWKEENISQFDNALLEKLPKSLKNITLSGGEPFLRNDLSEIVERVKSVCSKTRIVILTNGILTDIITEQMKKIIKIAPINDPKA